MQNVGGLAHLHHKSGLPAREIIARADAREDAVQQIHPRLRRRHKAAGVRQKRDQCYLPYISALARHIGPSDEGDLFFAAQPRVIRNKPLIQKRLLQHRMTPLADFQRALASHVWAAIAV